MELVSGGELGEWIVKKGSFTENMARHVFVQLVEGLLGGRRDQGLGFRVWGLGFGV